MYRYVDTLQYTTICIEEVFKFFLNKKFLIRPQYACLFTFFLYSWVVIFSMYISDLFIFNFYYQFSKFLCKLLKLDHCLLMNQYWMLLYLLIVSWWCWWMMKWHWYYFNILVTLDLIVGAVQVLHHVIYIICYSILLHVIGLILI
jgi:hypothetical protein